MIEIPNYERLYFTGSHWTYEILGILLSGNLKPLKLFKAASMLELVPDYASRIRDQPSPRLIDTHIRLKYLPQTVMDTVSLLIFFLVKPYKNLNPWLNVNLYILIKCIF